MADLDWLNQLQNQKQNKDEALPSLKQKSTTESPLFGETLQQLNKHAKIVATMTIDDLPVDSDSPI
jgi:hypothetical protein